MVKGYELLGERPQNCDAILLPCNGCRHCTLERAIKERTRSNHHKGFYVGAAILSEGNGSWHIVGAPNLYGHKDDKNKICAEAHTEQRQIELERREGPLHRVALAVVARDDRDRIEDINGPAGAATLCPCAACRGYYAVEPSVRWDMEVYTAGVDERGNLTIIERRSMGEVWETFATVRPPNVTARPVYGVEAARLLLPSAVG